MAQEILNLSKYMMNGRVLIGDSKFMAVFLLLGLFFSFSCNKKYNLDPELELEVTYSLDSTYVKSIGYINPFGKQGEWYFFDDQGHLELIENYKDDIVHGKVEMFICCRKFQELTAFNGKIIGRVTNFSPNGEIVSISYYDSSQSGFSLNLYESKAYEINKFDANRNIKLIYSDTSIIEIPDQFPASYGCCKIDEY